MRRMMVTVLAALILLTGPRPQAAINLLGASNAQLDFGDVPMGGETAVSVAVTVRLVSPFSGASRFVSKWGDDPSEQAFVLIRQDTDEVGLIANDSIFTRKYGCATTDSPLVAGDVARIVGVISVSPQSCRIWVNGTERTTTLTFTDAPMFSIRDVTTPLQIGHETDEAEDGTDGDFAEVAVWVQAIPDHVAISYGQGFSPQFFRQYLGAFYAPLLNTNTEGLRDVWGGILGTNTAGTSASHPPVYRHQQAH
jgi:hypothetical protein